MFSATNDFSEDRDEKLKQNKRYSNFNAASFQANFKLTLINSSTCRFSSSLVFYSRYLHSPSFTSGFLLESSGLQLSIRMFPALWLADTSRGQLSWPPPLLRRRRRGAKDEEPQQHVVYSLWHVGHEARGDRRPRDFPANGSDSSCCVMAAPRRLSTVSEKNFKTFYCS